MITVRDLKDNIDMQGDIVVRIFNEQDEVIAEVPFLNVVADWALDSEVLYMYAECVDNIPDALAIIIEIRKEN